MTSVEDVTETLRQKLESTGALHRLRAQLRAEVSHALESDEPPPAAAVPDENLLIFELVRDFLHYNRLTSTLSVFTSETGAPSLPLDRAELAVLVGVTDDAHSVQLPLLYELVERSKLRHAPPPPPPPPLSPPLSAPSDTYS